MILTRRLVLIIVLLAVLTPRPGAGQETVTLFVTSEKTDTVGVYRGTVPDLSLVRAIAVGRGPHNLGISPGGRWVATSDRHSGEVSDRRAVAARNEAPETIIRRPRSSRKSNRWGADLIARLTGP